MYTQDLLFNITGLVICIGLIVLLVIFIFWRD